MTCAPHSRLSAWPARVARDVASRALDYFDPPTPFGHRPTRDPERRRGPGWRPSILSTRKMPYERDNPTGRKLASRAGAGTLRGETLARRCCFVRWPPLAIAVNPPFLPAPSTPVPRVPLPPMLRCFPLSFYGRRSAVLRRLAVPYRGVGPSPFASVPLAKRVTPGISRRNPFTWPPSDGTRTKNPSSGATAGRMFSTDEAVPSRSRPRHVTRCDWSHDLRPNTARPIREGRSVHAWRPSTASSSFSPVQLAL